MFKRRLFIRDRYGIPTISRITGINVIDLEFEFDKADILNRVCVLEVDLTEDQIAEIEKSALEEME